MQAYNILYSTVMGKKASLNFHLVAQIPPDNEPLHMNNPSAFIFKQSVKMFWHKIDVHVEYLLFLVLNYYQKPCFGKEY
jgi:hypothetical protein